MSRFTVGAMTEQLVLQTAAAPTLVVVSITRAGSVATVTTLVPHNRVTGDFVELDDAVPVGYRGRFKVTVTGPTTLTCTVNPGLSTPATTPGTLTYATNAAGGQNEVWRTIDTFAAEQVSVGVTERLQADTLQGVEVVRFRIYARTDIVGRARVLWTPAWPMGAARVELGVIGTRPIPNEPNWAWLDTTRRTR
jgi:hypothetical protein